MSIEELLRPRYKVIADYPKSLYHVGDIINAGGTGEDCIYCDREGPRMRHYPHLFQPLRWWQELAENEMPSFVKDTRDGVVYKILSQSPHTPSDALVVYAKGRGWISLYDTAPATEEEYTLYITQTNPQ